MDAIYTRTKSLINDAESFLVQLQRDSGGDQNVRIPIIEKIKKLEKIIQTLKAVLEQRNQIEDEPEEQLIPQHENFENTY